MLTIDLSHQRSSAYLKARSLHLLSPILFPIEELPQHSTGQQAGHRQ